MYNSHSRYCTPVQQGGLGGNHWYPEMLWPLPAIVEERNPYKIEHSYKCSRFSCLCKEFKTAYAVQAPGLYLMTGAQ